MQFVIYIIVGFAVLMGLIIYLSIMAEKRRTKKLNDLSLQIGFTISQQKHYQVPQFDLFNRGHSKKSKNVMRGRRSGVNWVVFDYQYTTGGGKNSHTAKHTVAHAKLDNVIVPFHLSRENIGHKLIALVGFNDIDFSSHPVFSKTYYLKSKSDDVRVLFNTKVLDYFEHKKPRYLIEARDHDMLIYLRKRIKPANYIKFLDEAAEIVKLFRK